MLNTFIVFNEIYMFSIDYNTFMKKRNYPSSLYSIPKTDMFFSSGLSALKTLIKKPRSFYIQSALVLRCVFNIYHKVTNLIHSHSNQSLLEEQSFDRKRGFQKTQALENPPSKNRSSSLTARKQS